LPSLSHSPIQSTTVTAAKILLSNCPNFEWVPDTLPDFAERNGLDDVKYNVAIEAALRAYSGYDYVESAARCGPLLSQFKSQN
jgi:hypothetical protein